jgi:hypothetical protein
LSRSFATSIPPALALASSKLITCILVFQLSRPSVSVFCQ